MEAWRALRILPRHRLARLVGGAGRPSGAPDALQRFLYYTSWLLAVPLLALGMGLVGQVLYPCVVRPDAVPVKQQLAKLAKADADADAAGDPAPIAPSDFKLYWRVVTRGLSPDLVAANVHSAFAVLKESGLPRERWEVEVVCDNAMGLPERTGTEVLEVVVPSDYKCPNGGKFKARALHWGALHGSPRGATIDHLHGRGDEIRRRHGERHTRPS